MGTVGKLIRDSFGRGFGLSQKMLDGVPNDRFARLATPGGVTVHSNHPAFIYGHLSLYPHRIAEMLGLDVPETSYSDAYLDLFKGGAECLDDAEGSIYPSRDEIIGLFTTAHEAIAAKVAELPDEAFDVETPNERYRQVFPTTGIVTNFLLTSHLMLHIGQMSAWRRCEGLGSVM